MSQSLGAAIIPNGGSRIISVSSAWILFVKHPPNNMPFYCSSWFHSLCFMGLFFIFRFFHYRGFFMFSLSGGLLLLFRLFCMLRWMCLWLPCFLFFHFLFMFQMKLLDWFCRFLFLVLVKSFFNCLQFKLSDTTIPISILFTQNHFVMEEIVLDSLPKDCISCLRFGRESNLLLVSSWDAVLYFDFLSLLVYFSLWYWQNKNVKSLCK